MLKPIYKMSKPNKPVYLAKGKTKYTYNKSTSNGTCNLYLKFNPTTNLEFKGLIAYKEPFVLPDFTSKSGFTLELSSAKLKTKVLPISLHIDRVSPKIEIIAVPLKEPLTIGNIGNKSAKVIFHILNFRNFLSETQVRKGPKQSSTLLGHAILESDEWLITIDGQLSTENMIKELRKTGGYGLTHVGCIERKDGKLFTKKATDEILRILYYFLSFARGFRVSPLLPVGFNKKNDRTWEEWGIHKIDPYISISTFSWFDDMKCKLSDIFPHFLKLIKRPKWEKPVQKVILWYLLSNQRHAATEGSLILTQTALELLAWVYLVEDKSMLDADGFKRLTAAQNIKLLISSLGLPLQIPNQLEELTQLGKEYDWKDGPQCVAEIRNSVVHPNHKKGIKLQKGIFEAWNLGQWYIELILLRLFQYKGSYSNRLKLNRWRGEVEPIP